MGWLVAGGNRLDGHAGLPHTAGTGQGNEPDIPAGQQRLHLADFTRTIAC
jgi:hypothetical protein